MAVSTVQDMLTPEEKVWADETANKIKKKMEVVRERSAKKIPSAAMNGVHDDKAGEGKGKGGKAYWTNGFWAGIMWLMNDWTGEARYGEIARFTEEIMDECVLDFYGLDHDIGYMWIPSAVLDYKLTGDEDALRRGLLGANLLAGRFNPAGEYIRAWDGEAWEGFNTPGVPKMRTEGVAIIDCMLNLPLLYWAYEITGDPRFRIIARKHGDKVMRNFIREDGSVIHIVEFDPETGEFVRDYGGQGYGQGSSWTRGQAWGLYGFTSSYRHTNNREYLDTAKRIAAYFMANIPESGLIPSDFCQPKEPHVQDDIAAAAAACGLLQLAGAAQEESRSYVETAIKMLRAIDEKSADWSRETDGITLNGTMAYHTPGRNMNYVYGDYFFIEAVLKLKGQEVFVW